jgi:sulfur-oxidizing protein SoxX
MPKPGSAPSRPKSGAESVLARAALVAALAAASAPWPAAGAPMVVGDAIPSPLAGLRGDPARGRAIVASRQKGLCLLCHSGPFPEVPLQGNLAPDLAHVGSRLSAAQLRLRVVDSRRLVPDSIMPPYFATEGLVRVAPAFAGRPLLGAQEIEDVVSFLETLR